jgi:hypothetical protein
MAFYGSLFLTPGQQGDEPRPFTLKRRSWRRLWPLSG